MRLISRPEKTGSTHIKGDKMGTRIIGLTGGIASGKSLVSKIFEKHNSYIIDTDKIGHAVMLTGEPAYNEILGVFGSGILAENSEIDRKKLGAVVFHDAALMQRLIEITHRRIIDKTLKVIKALENSSYDYIIIEAPLLFEAGMQEICDAVVLVLASEEKRRERIINRDGLSGGEAVNRINKQANYEKYIEMSDYVLHNDKGLDELEREVKKIINGEIKKD